MTLSRGHKSFQTRLRNRNLNNYTNNKVACSLVDYIAITIGGICFLVVPLCIAVSTAINVTVGDNFVVRTAIAALMSREFMIVIFGVAFCMAMRAIEGFSSLLGRFIGFYLRIFMRVVIITAIVTAGLSAMIGSGITNMMHSGQQYVAANQDDNGEEQMLVDRISGLKVEYDDAWERNCRRALRCPNRSAEVINKEIKDAERELITVREARRAAETGGYDMASALSKWFGLDIDVLALGGLTSLINAIIYALGTFIYPYIATHTYYPPLARLTSRRKAQEEFIDTIYGSEEDEYYAPRGPSLSSVALAQIKRLKSGITNKLAPPPLKLNQTPPPVQSAHLAQDVQSWGVQMPPALAAQPDCTPPTAQVHTPNCTPPTAQVHTSNCTGAHPVRSSAHPVQPPIYGAVQSTAQPVHTPTAQPVHTPVQPKKASVSPIRKGLDTGCAAIDRALSDRVKAAHPDYPGMSDVVLMTTIKREGAAMNSEGTGVKKRIGETKARRVFNLMTGRKYQPKK